MVPPNSHRVSRAPRYSGYHYQLYHLTRTGLSPPMVQLSRWFQFSNTSNHVVLQPHNCRNNYGLGYSDFARHYSRNHSCFLLLRLLRCFSSPGSLSLTAMTGLQPAGLPHSDICGSQLMCNSPQLFAAYHVLLRLWEPRHPPYALV